MIEIIRGKNDTCPKYWWITPGSDKCNLCTSCAGILEVPVVGNLLRKNIVARCMYDSRGDHALRTERMEE